MAKRQFTEEEIAFLRRNLYIVYVDENRLSFTVPFKIEYMRLHNEGVMPREILLRLGCPIEIIGKSRLVDISQDKKNVMATHPTQIEIIQNYEGIIRWTITSD
nr:HTH domain-containing protein [uncultured Stomatobaculum sp.]